MRKKYYLKIIFVCLLCCLMGCGAPKNNTVVLFDWGISYDELKEQIDDAYRDVSYFDEYYACGAIIENYNGDKGITGTIAYMCNEDTHILDEVRVQVEIDGSDDYDIDSLYEKYVNEFKEIYGTPDDESTILCEWSTDDENITLIGGSADEALNIYYECINK